MEHQPYDVSINGVLAEIRYQKQNFFIGKLENGSAVKGLMMVPQVGLKYKFFGKWVFSQHWGNTFFFSRYERDFPTNLEAIRAYLEENAKWVGPEVSKKIVEAYGEESLKILKDDPDRAAREISGLTPARAQEVSGMLKNLESHEELEIALNGILEGIPVSSRVRCRILEIWGKDAPDKLKDNPYALIDLVEGVGFLTADRIARKVGYKLDGIPRIRAGILYLLQEAAWNWGHTHLPKDVLAIKASEILSVGREKIIAALPELEKTGMIVIRGDLVYLAELYADEMVVAERLRLMKANP